MPENICRQNQIPFSFLKSEKKPPFFLSLDENEKLCCWGSQQTLVSTFRNEDEDARTNGAFRFLLRFKRQNTSNFLFCRRRRQRGISTAVPKKRQVGKKGKFTCK